MISIQFSCQESSQRAQTLTQPQTGSDEPASVGVSRCLFNRETLHRLVTEASARTEQSLLTTPYFIEPNGKDANSRRDKYALSVEEIAAPHHAELVDVQATFDGVPADLHPATLTRDRIPPGPADHMIIVRALLRLAGC